MRKRHSDATKLAAVFLAQQSSVDGAAEALGIDPRTIRGWLETVELPADRWTAIRDVLQARAGEMAAKGETRGLVQTLTGAGIADRNVRYSTLIARREARRAEAEKPPEKSHMATEFARLDDLRCSLVRAEIALVAVRRVHHLDPEPPDMDAEAFDQLVTDFVDGVVAMTDEQVRARLEVIHAEHRAIDGAERERERLERERLAAEREASRPAPRGFDHAVNVTPRTRELDAEERQLVIEAETFLLEFRS
jgi:hypothetical protein